MTHVSDGQVTDGDAAVRESPRRAFVTVTRRGSTRRGIGRRTLVTEGKRS